MVEVILAFAFIIFLIILPYCFFLWFLIEAVLMIGWKKHSGNFRRWNVIRLCIAGIPSVLFLIFLSPYNNWVNGIFVWQ